MIKFDHEILTEPVPCEWFVGRVDNDYITITRKRQEDGSFKFAVYDGDRFVLRRDGSSFDYESFPSNRPEDWYETHRFDDFAEAKVMAVSAARRVLKEVTKRVAFMNEKAAEKAATEKDVV